MNTATHGHHLTEGRIERIGLPDGVMTVTDFSAGQTGRLTIQAPKLLKEV